MRHLNKTILLDDIWKLIKETQECQGYLVNPILTKYALTHLQLQVLIEIDRTDDMSLNELAESLMMNNGNASTLCKKLEHEGLLIRERRLDDERFISLHLTDNGKLVVEDLDVRIKEYISSIPISQNSFTKIQEGITVLHEIMNKMHHKQREDDYIIEK